MEPPLRLLSLDGGGIKGLSSLYILRHLLSAIQRQIEAQDPSKKTTTTLRPCEYFDMIAGTSTGGLIAVMLGILRMDIQTCIDAYLAMAPKIFPVGGIISGSKFGRLKNALKGDSRFDPAPLELAIKDLVEEHLAPDATGNEMMRSRSGENCRIFVCVSSEKPFKNFRFRNYDSPKGAFEDVAIWEACRATSAAPTYFPPISIGNPSRTFVDGGMGYNNPTQALLEECTQAWPSRPIGCIVSIGTGMAGSQDVGRTLKPLMETLKSISTDTEKVAREIKEQIAYQYPAQKVYYRFNVQQGLQSVGLEEWKELGRVQTVTEDYLQDNWREIDSCASRIFTRVNSHTLPVVKEGYSTIPFPRDDDFIGRDGILKQLDVLLSASRTRRWAALYGLGGIGKSQIAIEHTYRAREIAPRISTFWVHASTEARFEQSFSVIAAEVGIAGDDGKKVDPLQDVSAWLTDPKNGDWLLIIDNADDATVLTSPRSKNPILANNPNQSRLLDFVPQVQHGTVLITTRDRTCALDLIGSGLDPLYVNVMSQEESIQLVRTRLPKVSDDEASELVEELENVPLAITQAAAYVRAIQQVSVSMYLATFRRSNEDQATLLNKNKSDLRRDASVPNAVITAWELSFNQIGKTSPAAADLLSLMSYFHRQGIPKFLLQQEEDELSFLEKINPLLSFSMIRAEVGGETYAMHRLVQTSTRHWLRCERSEQLWKGRAMKRLADDHLAPGDQQKRWAVCEALMSHADEVLSHAVNSREWELNRARLLYRTAWYLVEKKGNPRLAEERSRLALEVQRMYLDEDSIEISATLNTLAYALSELSRYEEAILLGQSVLERSLKLNGPEHKSTLMAMHNLASSYYSSRQYSRAADLIEGTITVEQRLTGMEAFPSLLASIRLLAQLKAEQGQFGEAEKLLEPIVKEGTKTLEGEYSISLVAAAGLADIYQRQGKFRKTKELSRRIIPLLEKVFGPHHWRTLEVVIILATTHYKEGRLDEAEQLCAQCVENVEKQYGERNVHTMSVNNLLGLIYRAQGKVRLAIRLFEDLMEMNQGVHGSLHSRTLTTRYNLALSYYDRGDKLGAIDVMNDVDQKRRQILGVDDPSTIRSTNRLQRWRREQEAATLEELANCESEQGDSHQEGPDSAEIPQVQGTSLDTAEDRGLYERLAKVDISSQETGNLQTESSQRTRRGGTLFLKKFSLRKKV